MSFQEYRINSDIKATNLLLIDAEGEPKGIVKFAEAIHIAEEEGLDLVEIQPNAQPPVCRLMDYGKYRYDQQKKAHVAKKHQKQSEVKEIQFRPVIDDNDYKTKLTHIKEFLEDNHKVRVVVRMKGRERMNFELGNRMLARLRTDLQPFAQFEDSPTRMNDGQFLLFASPIKLVKKVSASSNQASSNQASSNQASPNVSAPSPKP